MCPLHQCDFAAARSSLHICLASVQSWMLVNKLKLNPDKTVFLLIKNEQQRSKFLSLFPVELLGVVTNPTKSARNLGGIFGKIALIYLQSAAHAVTIFGTCGVFADT